MSPTVKAGASPKAPDNLWWWLPDFAWLKLDDVTLFEATGKAGRRERIFEVIDEGTPSEERWDAGARDLSNALVIARPDGTTLVYRTIRAEVHERGTSISTSKQLYVYDKDKQLTTYVHLDTDDGEMLELPAVESFSVDHLEWRDHKLVSVRTVGSSIGIVLEVLENTWTASPSS